MGTGSVDKEERVLALAEELDKVQAEIKRRWWLLVALMVPLLAIKPFTEAASHGHGGSPILALAGVAGVAVAARLLWLNSRAKKRADAISRDIIRLTD